MNSQYKERLRKLIKPIFQFLLLGLGYYLLISFTNISLPCLIQLATGKYCPGCGITRMLIAFLRLDFEAAFLSNRLLFFLLPLLLIYGLIKVIIYIKTGQNTQTKWEQFLSVIVCIIIILFWILRNTSTFAYLAPM